MVRMSLTTSETLLVPDTSDQRKSKQHKAMVRIEVVTQRCVVAIWIAITGSTVLEIAGSEVRPCRCLAKQRHARPTTVAAGVARP